MFLLVLNLSFFFFTYHPCLLVGVVYEDESGFECDSILNLLAPHLDLQVQLCASSRPGCCDDGELDIDVARWLINTYL